MRRKKCKISKEPKIKRIEIRVSFEELDKIDLKAKKAGLDRSTYIRACACNCKLREKPGREFYESLRDLRKIEIGLRLINKDRLSNDKVDIKELADKIEKMIFECYKTFQ